MAFNRIVYCLTLILALVFYFASATWAAWVLLVMIAVLPWVSLLLSLPVMLMSRVETGLPPRAEQGETAMLHLRVRAPRLLPLPEVRVRLNLRTRDRERDIRFLSRLTRADGILPLPTETCGFLAPEFLKGRVYDALGLFWLRLRTPAVAPMAILAPAKKPDPLPDLEQFLHLQLKPKPGGGYSEIHDNRPYRPGDPVKGIHWKLSLKADELIVREPQDTVRRQVILALRTPYGPEQRANNLGNLRYLSAWLLSHGVEHSLVWMEADHLCRAEIGDPEHLIRAMERMCCAAETTRPLPAELPFHADWLCRVGEEGGDL